MDDQKMLLLMDLYFRMYKFSIQQFSNGSDSQKYSETNFCYILNISPLNYLTHNRWSNLCLLDTWSKKKICLIFDL